MSPEILAAAIVGMMILCILASVASVMDWIADTVFPDMWEVGKLFDMPPTIGEVRLQKAAKGAAHLMRLMLLLMIGQVVVAACSAG